MAAEIAALSGHKINLLSSQGPAIYELCLEAQGSNFTAPMVRLKLHCAQNCLKWLNIDVTSKIRGRGAGLMAVKAMLGFAYERADATIQINNPTDIGFGFWASLGATPQNTPYRMGAHIRLALQNHGLSMGRACVEQWKRVAALSEKNPSAGWHEIATYHWAKKDGEKHNDHPCAPARLAVLKQAAQGENLHIDLTNPVTLSTLQRRIGRVPFINKTQRSNLG